MKIFGIELAPLHIPWKRRLETFIVYQWVVSFMFLGFGCLFTAIYILLFTQYWYLVLAYLVYYMADRGVDERGGRGSEWVRNWWIWRHYADFFPITLEKEGDLDPEKNYIIGSHPHGIFSIAGFAHFGTYATGWAELFPGIKPHLLVLPGHFQFPLYRDYLMLSGNLFSYRINSIKNTKLIIHS